MLKYYRLLNVRYDAPRSEIKQAYRELVRIWHPDRFPNDVRKQRIAHEKLIQLNEAYRMLCKLTPEPEVGASFEPIDWSDHFEFKEHSYEAPHTIQPPAQPTGRGKPARWYNRLMRL